LNTVAERRFAYYFMSGRRRDRRRRKASCKVSPCFFPLTYVSFFRLILQFLLRSPTWIFKKTRKELRMRFNATTTLTSF